MQERPRRVASVRLGMASPKADSGASLCLHAGMNADNACLSHCRWSETVSSALRQPHGLVTSFCPFCH